MLVIVFFKATAHTEIYTYCPTLSLHDALPSSERKHLFLLPRDIGGVARVADQALGHVWRDTAKLRRKRGERLPRHLRKAEPFEQRARDPVLPHLQSGAEQLRRSQLRIQHPPAVRMCRQIGRESCRDRVCQ